MLADIGFEGFTQSRGFKVKSGSRSAKTEPCRAVYADAKQDCFGAR